MVAYISAGCHLIDDDLSVCGADYLINYQMRLVTEMEMTVDEKLSSETEKPIAESLKRWLAPIFSGKAHDLEMDFYSLDGTDELKHHFADVVDDTRKSYTLTISREDYWHLAVVNIADNPSVSLLGTQMSSSMRVAQQDADTVASHATAVYSARLKMIMPEDKEQDLSFDVHLYMLSSAVALVVIDSTKNVKPVMKQVLLSGTATGFNVSDSIFTFAKPSVVRAERVIDNCYAVVSLPSHDDQPWDLNAYTQMPDGTITETKLTINKPLKAGALEIIQVCLQDDGSLMPVQKTEVGATVVLDWKAGSEQELITG